MTEKHNLAKVEAENASLKEQLEQKDKEIDSILDDVWEVRERYEETLKAHCEIFKGLIAKNSCLMKQLEQARAEAAVMREALEEFSLFYDDSRIGGNFERACALMEKALSTTGAEYAKRVEELEKVAEVAKKAYDPNYLIGTKCNSMECQSATLYEPCPGELNCPHVKELKQALAALDNHHD